MNGYDPDCGCHFCANVRAERAASDRFVRGLMLYVMPVLLVVLVGAALLDRW